MDAIIDAQNLAWIRRLSTLRYAVKNVLIHAGWRGATFDEIATAVGYPAELVRDELVSNNDYVHCPGCDYWSTWRGGEPFVPKGACHDLFTCCLSDPFASKEGRAAAKKNGVFHVNNYRREEGVKLREIQLFIEPKSKKLRLHDPTTAT